MTAKTSNDLAGAPHALIMGATGVIGRYIAAELVAAGWRVTGLARGSAARVPVTGVQTLSADLEDADSVLHACAQAAPFTHVFYSAFKGAPNWEAATEPNARMFRHAVQAVRRHDAQLSRFVLVTGAKYYGSHLGPVPVPLREHHPRHTGLNFYFDQVDALIEAQRGRHWSWAELRPHTLCGYAPGTPMSLAMVLAVYGALCADLGEPLHFPGTPRGWESVYQVTDSGLFARAAHWAATDARAANQAYNITNGEVFRWRDIWPALADCFGLVPGEPQQFRLADFMARHASRWEALVARHGLQSHPLEHIAPWDFGDYVFSIQWDIVSSVVKARQHGFCAAMDSEQMFATLFDRLRADRVIPDVQR